MIDVLERIAVLQKERGWTTYRLAEEAAITQSTLTIMFLRKTLPSLTTLDHICMAFGITPEEFFKEDPASTTKDSMMLSQYNRLSPRDKETVLVLIEHLAESR